MEPAVKDALYGSAHAPAVVGERDDQGRPLLASTGVVSPDAIGRAIGRQLLAREELPAVRVRLDKIDAVAHRPAIVVRQTRTPHFCSGCPHSASTKAPDNSIVGAGIGCHTMVMLTTTGRGRVSGTTQMGGEGAQWIGAAPFIAPRHFVQNLSDGTFHHSGSLAIRAAIASELNVTYKVPYNETVTMKRASADARETVVELAQLPDVVRGYEPSSSLTSSTSAPVRGSCSQTSNPLAETKTCQASTRPSTTSARGSASCCTSA